MHLTSGTAALSSHRQIFDLPVCDLDWPGAFSLVSALADRPAGQTVVSFLNAHNANALVKDSRYREALERNLVLPDGIGIDVASVAMFGEPFPANLNGTDFIPGLMTYMTAPKRIGLVGARPEILARARDAFAAHAPWHEVVAIHHGYFPEDQSPAVADEIARHEVDVLLVAMGTPKQEKWIDRHIRAEHARLVIGVGALFDFAAGAVPRAPRIMRSMRMEWLFRLIREPRRLAGRYLLGGPAFLARVAARALSMRKPRSIVPGTNACDPWNTGNPSGAASWPHMQR
jgi:exopolysaccharide biosynthesis WecB/TagA/CpsF family protein